MGIGYAGHETSPFTGDEDLPQPAPAPTASEPMFPDAEPVIIVGQENAGAIMGAVSESMRQAGAPREEIDSWRRVAMAGTYEDLRKAISYYVPVVFL